MFNPTPLVRYADPAFSQDRTRYCILRLQVSEEELLLSVYDSLSASFPLLEKYTIRNGFSGLKTHEALSRILQTHPLTRLPFKETEVIIASPDFTLIPSALFEESKSEEFLGISTTIKKPAETGIENFVRQEMKLVYSWPASWKRAIVQAFPSATIHHYSFYLLQGILNQPSETAVYAHVQDFREDIIVVKEGKLMFFNSFSFQSPEDFLYYILLAYDRHELNRELIPLKLLGEIEQGSALYSLCYKYIREINFMNRPGNSLIPKAEGESGELPDHFYFNLLHPGNENNQR